jgi:Polysaccharide lyase
MPWLRRLDLRGGTTRGIGRTSTTSAQSTVANASSSGTQPAWRGSTPPRQALLVLLFVAAFLGATAVLYGTPGTASAAKPHCNNGIDDDGDGKIDYPADPGCTGKGDKSEVDTVQPPPSPPPPPPPPSVVAIDSFCDTTTPWGQNLINRWYTVLGDNPWYACNSTGTPWPDGGGMWEISTPYGPGFRMIATDEMKVLSGGKRAQIADIGHLVGPVGSTEDWSGKMMFPAAGNPNGFPRNYPDWGILVDFHDSSAGAGGGGIGIDTTDAPFRNNFYFDWNLRGVKRKAVSPNQLVYDRWYSWRIQLKFSSGSDGFIKWWLDGQLLADWTGPTLAAGEVPYLQFGFYSAAQLSNEVRHADLRLVE